MFEHLSFALWQREDFNIIIYLTIGFYNYCSVHLFFSLKVLKVTLIWWSTSTEMK